MYLCAVPRLKPPYLRFTVPAQHEKGKLLLKIRLMSNDSARGAKQLPCCKCCPLGKIQRPQRNRKSLGYFCQYVTLNALSSFNRTRLSVLAVQHQRSNRVSKHTSEQALSCSVRLSRILVFSPQHSKTATNIDFD